MLENRKRKKITVKDKPIWQAKRIVERPLAKAVVFLEFFKSDKNS